jgi:hypothetical protein
MTQRSRDALASRAAAANARHRYPAYAAIFAPLNVGGAKNPIGEPTRRWLKAKVSATLPVCYTKTH